MLKILIGKQLKEVGAFLYQDNKKGTRRSRRGRIGYMLLLIGLYIMMGWMFGMVAYWVGSPLISGGMDWLYFSLMGLMSIALGVFGSVFNTYSSLYIAKDNEMLLSMPIRESDILIARLSGVYIMGLSYEAMVFIPTLVVYFLCAGIHAGAVVGGLLTMISVSMFVLVLSCLLGWVVALISLHLKNKAFITVIISLAFIGAYYYFYAMAYEYIAMLVQNAELIGETIKSKVFPIYCMGVGATGSMLHLLCFMLMVAVLLAAVYLILLRSFSRIMTTKKGEKRVSYKEQRLVAGNVDSALFKKELKRFTSSATYMLNCGLGTIVLLLGAAALIWKQTVVREALGQFGDYGQLMVLLAAAALAMVSSMNDITVPSVSLEGKNIWILQSLPVSPWQVLKAKLKVHLALTLVPMLVCTVCVECVLCPNIYSMIMLPLLTVSVVFINALSGLVVGLLSPNLNWTSETAAVKQSMGVMLALFGNWLFIIAVCGIYALVWKVVTPELYMLLCVVIFSVLNGLMLRWLKEKGSRIFSNL